MDEISTILIVDDEPGGREALEGVLFAQGYHLIFAENGTEAYQKALDEIPDLVLLDVMMPNLDGFAVCRMMRSDPLLAEMPILMVTALDDRASRLKGIEAGADDFITKPFDRVELRARIRTITRLNRYRRLLMERARFVWVVDQATEGYVILNEQGLVTYTNPAAQTWLNLPDPAEHQEPFWKLVQNGYRCEPEEGWASLAETGSAEQALYLIHPEDANSHLTWLLVEPLRFPSGGAPSTLVRISEITPKIALEAHVKSFHTRVSHKLRTPVANIRMAADFLLRQMIKEGKNDSLDLPRAMIQNAARLETEIKDILAYQKVLAIPTQANCSLVADLEVLIPHICGDVGIAQSAVKVEQGLDQVRMKLSREALAIALKEVLENARKFHPQRTPEILVRASTDSAGGIILSIQDDGVHLSPEQIGQAWLPYYQAEKEFTGEVPGLGLGLSMVAILVWGCGGKGRILNRADRPGVVVELIIPREDAQSTNGTAKQAGLIERILK